MGFLDSSDDDSDAGSSISSAAVSSSKNSPKEKEFLDSSDDGSDDSSVSSAVAMDALAAAAFRNINPCERNPSILVHNAPPNDNKATAAAPAKRQSLIQIMLGRGDATQEQAESVDTISAAGARRQSVFGRDTTQAKPKGAHIGRRMSTFAMGVKTNMKHLINRDKGVRWSTGNAKDAPQEMVHFIETLEELFEDGLIEKVWFTDKEMGVMKEEADMVAESIDVNKMDISDNSNSKSDDTSKDNYPGIDIDGEGRGLEYRTEEGNWKAYKARKDATDALLDEQERQEENKRFAMPDDEEIATAVAEVTEPFMQEAAGRAKEDALVAAAICQEEWKAERLRTNACKV